MTGFVVFGAPESSDRSRMADSSKLEARRQETLRGPRETRPPTPPKPRCHCGAVATLVVTKWRSTEHCCKEHAPRRRPKTPPGPVPTMGQIAKEDAWVWAYCGLGCNHSAAIPLPPLVDRLGADASSDRLRSALTCSVCGKRGATIRKPSWSVTTQSYGGLPFDLAPPWARRHLANAALSAIGVELR